MFDGQKILDEAGKMKNKGKIQQVLAAVAAGQDEVRQKKRSRDERENTPPQAKVKREIEEVKEQEEPTSNDHEVDLNAFKREMEVDVKLEEMRHSNGNNAEIHENVRIKNEFGIKSEIV
ncbi:hypothetical protein TrLO_g14971 [Triparma laevis f. longispina]|uniref:Uncharacterized protein n=1 Tax=Triparma laevis f. longispina TaxID=1714387 RepID=A0A9W7B443_9STRA|nr:hypothetical protein TrLO_g14971 [Triparma laevis f. longispina]